MLLNMKIFQILGLSVSKYRSRWCAVNSSYRNCLKPHGPGHCGHPTCLNSNELVCKKTSCQLENQAIIPPTEICASVSKNEDPEANGQ